MPSSKRAQAMGRDCSRVAPRSVISWAVSCFSVRAHCHRVHAPLAVGAHQELALAILDPAFDLLHPAAVRCACGLVPVHSHDDHTIAR